MLCADGCGFPDQTFIGHDRHIAFDPVFFAAIDRDRAPPGGRIARDDFCRHKLENERSR